MLCHASVRTGAQIPRTHVNARSAWSSTYNPCLRRRKGGFLLSQLATMVSSGFDWQTRLHKWGRINGRLFWTSTSGLHTRVCTHMQIHIYTHTTHMKTKRKMCHNHGTTLLFLEPILGTHFFFLKFNKQGCIYSEDEITLHTSWVCIQKKQVLRLGSVQCCASIFRAMEN